MIERENPFNYVLEPSELELLKTSIAPYIISNKEDGGYKLRNWDYSTETPNASIHIDKDGNVTSGHNQSEVQKILKQIETENDKKQE